MTTPDEPPVNVEETLRKIRTLIDSILGPSEGHHYEVVLQDDVGLTDEVRPQSGTSVLVLAGTATATATANEPEIRVTEAEILETESRLAEYAKQAGWDVGKTVVAQAVLKTGKWIIEMLTG